MYYQVGGLVVLRDNTSLEVCHNCLAFWTIRDGFNYSFPLHLQLHFLSQGQLQLQLQLLFSPGGQLQLQLQLLLSQHGKLQLLFFQLRFNYFLITFGVREE